MYTDPGTLDTVLSKTFIPMKISHTIKVDLHLREIELDCDVLD